MFPVGDVLHGVRVCVCVCVRVLKCVSEREREREMLADRGGVWRCSWQDMAGD